MLTPFLMKRILILVKSHAYKELSRSYLAPKVRALINILAGQFDGVNWKSVSCPAQAGDSVLTLICRVHDFFSQRHGASLVKSRGCERLPHRQLSERVCRVDIAHG